MSNDWDNPDKDAKLPPPGEGWGDSHNPDPLHQVPDNSWGNAPGGAPPGGPPAGPPPGAPPMGPPPTDGSVDLSSPQHPGWHPPGDAPAGPPPGGPPVGPPPGGHGGPLMHQPSSNMQTSQLDQNDILALVLSVFFPGAGHIVQGQTTKGIAILAATYLTCGAGYIFFALVVADCYMVSMAKKKRPVDEWEFFPQ